MKQHKKEHVSATLAGIVTRTTAVRGPEVPVPGGYATTSRKYRPGRQLL